MAKPIFAFDPYLWLRARGGAEPIWYIVYPDRDGNKKQMATPLRGQGSRKSADKYLAAFTERLKAKRLVDGGEDDDAPLTVTRWAGRWLETRANKGISTVDDYRSRLEHHILPIIGDLRLDAVTPDHVVDVMGAVAKKGLAPRTQLHVYATMRTMFSRAVPRFIESNPCCIPSEDLPAKKDLDPEWRPTAIFSREEVRLILSSPDIPPDRRVFYAVMFLGGLRFGEIAALDVRHYRPELAPLGQLQVSRSFNSKKARLKGVKTDRPRLVPVHPWLAKILGDWLGMGWPEMMGRPPGPDDILIPTRQGGRRKSHVTWKQLNGEREKKEHAAVPGDLDRLGLRSRRLHDARRTFITLARADGARKDLLRLISHGPEGDIVDIYTEMPWGALCEEVAKLKLEPLPRQPLAAVSNAAGSLEAEGAQGCHQGCHSENLLEFPQVTERPQRDSNPQTESRQSTTDNATDRQSAESLGFEPPPQSASGAIAGQPGTTATLATLAMRQALAALEKGRLDQAIDILRRAIEAERGDDVSGAGGAL